MVRSSMFVCRLSASTTAVAMRRRESDEAHKNDINNNIVVEFTSALLFLNSKNKRRHTHTHSYNETTQTVQFKHMLFIVRFSVFLIFLSCFYCSILVFENIVARKKSGWKKTTHRTHSKRLSSIDLNSILSLKKKTIF